MYILYFNLAEFLREKIQCRNIKLIKRVIESNNLHSNNNKSMTTKYTNTIQ